MRLVIVTAILMVETSIAALSPTVRLNNGYEIPVVGLGVFEADDSETEQAVKDAIGAGYRHIDTAFYYGNEAAVGRGVNVKIAEGVIKREDIFITTKLWGTFHEPDQVERAFSKSLENLNTSYVDLYLIHSPIAYRRFNKDQTQSDPPNVDDVLLYPKGEDVFSDVDYLDTWKAMEQLVKSGRVRSIGISNFNSEQIDRLLAAAEIKPVVNQVECHPNLNQRKLLKFLADRDIVLVAYSPLGRPHSGGKNLAIRDPKVLELAEKHNKSPAQIILRYTYQNGGVVIPKSTHKERIQQNIDIFDFSLDEQEMQIIHELNSNTRVVPFEKSRPSKYYPFDLEF